MHQPDRSLKHALRQTWGRTVDVSPASRAGPVSTLRVKIIGTDTASDTAATFSNTKRYPSVLPSSEDRIPQHKHAYAERDWRVSSARDVTFLSAEVDDSDQALAFARTLPAISQDNIEIEESGVHEIDRLRLTLDPRDSDPVAAPGHQPPPHADALTPTLRVKPCAEAPLTRAWRLWAEQSPLITIGTAATFCFVSALLVSLLAP